MMFSFKLRDANGQLGEEFIKIDARYHDGFRLKDNESLLVHNNLDNSDLLIQNNSELAYFLAHEYLKRWDPLAEHKEFKAVDLSINPRHDPLSLIPPGAEISRANIADGTIIGESKAVDTHINPAHYKGYFQDYQWFEVMQDVLPDVDSAALSMVYKYLARSGKKDDKRQEALKALWYLKFYTARIIAGRNIRVSEIETILNSVK